MRAWQSSVHRIHPFLFNNLRLYIFMNASTLPDAFDLYYFYFSNIYIIYILFYHMICDISIAGGIIIMIKQKNFILIIALFTLLLFSSNIPVQAASPKEADSLTYEETIQTDSKVLSSTGKSGNITASKTGAYKDRKGNVVWSVTVTASFSFTGSSSKCTAVSASAVSNHPDWTILSKSCSRNGNKGSATAVAKNKSYAEKLTRTVSIQCSKTGKIS